MANLADWLVDKLTSTTPNTDQTEPARTASIAPWRPRCLVYALAVLSTLAVLLLSLKLPSMTGGAPVLMVFLVPVILSAYVGGLGPGLTATCLAALLANYFILPPIHSLHIAQATDGLRWGLLIVMGLLVSSISEALHRSRWRAEESQRRYAVTLGSIGDAVITTDKQGRITLLNAEAERLTGWTSREAEGQSLTAVFRIINEDTRQPAEDPAEKVLHTGTVAGLANHTLLVARNGTETPIDDSSAPIKQSDGEIIGVVLVFHDCTVKKRAEAAWQGRLKLQEQLARITATAPGTVCSFRQRPDGSASFPYASPAIEEIYGGSPEAAANDASAIFCLIHPEDIVFFNQAIAESARTLNPWRVEFRVRHPRKGELWVEGHAVPEREADGGTLWHGFLHDITERKQAERTLRESDDLYRSLVSASPDAVTVTNVEGRIEFVSTRALEIFGQPAKDEVIGRSLFDWVAPEEHEKVRASLRDLFETKRLQGSEFMLLKKDGTRFHGEINAALLRSADGRPKGVIFITRDITERKRAEEMQKRLATAVEQAAEDIMITDATGKILYVNPAFERITGYSREKVIGCNPRLLKSDKHDPAFYRKMWDTLSRGEVWSGRIINKRKDGTLFEEEATISPIRDAAGKIINYVGVRRDVTREVALETQLRQSQKMEAIGQLAGGIAHDFNNLLTAIRGNASMVLLSNQSQSEEISDCSQQIVEAAERAANLTRQLLMFSRKQVLQPIRLDLNEVVAQMTKLLQRILGEDISLASNYAAGLPAIQADTGMIEQILLNLAVNSRDAMPQGGRLVITTGTGTETADPATAGQNPGGGAGLYVLLTVTDTGCGIAPENLPHIFEPFFTTKEVGKGTGLGLATVHGIVQQHNGWITVTSEINRGTTFHIYFPAMTGVKTEIQASPTAVSLPRGTETILVVEDELIVRLTVSNMLQRFGYTVLPAESGVEALKVWQKHKDRIQLLLTDIVMPDGMTGYELARQLHADRPRLKIIYTSGYSGNLADKRLTMEEGVNFLQKPYAPQKLAEALRKNLDPK